MRIAMLSWGFLLAGCLTDRALAPENRALRGEIARLEARLAAEGEVPTLAALDALLTDDGHRSTQERDLLRSFCGEGEDRVAITVATHEEARVVYLGTNGWMRLSETAGEREVVLLLTQLAAINHELLVGKLQLNPASGEIALSIELPTDDGLGDTTFRRAVQRLCAAQEELRPRLRRALEATAL